MVARITLYRGFVFSHLDALGFARAGPSLLTLKGAALAWTALSDDEIDPKTMKILDISSGINTGNPDPYFNSVKEMCANS